LREIDRIEGEKKVSSSVTIMFFVFFNSRSLHKKKGSRKGIICTKVLLRGENCEDPKTFSARVENKSFLNCFLVGSRNLPVPTVSFRFPGELFLIVGCGMKNDDFLHQIGYKLDNVMMSDRQNERKHFERENILTSLQPRKKKFSKICSIFKMRPKRTSVLLQLIPDCFVKEGGTHVGSIAFSSFVPS